MQDQWADRFVKKQHLVYAQSSLIAELPALLATDPVPEFGSVDFVRRKPHLLQVTAFHLLFRLAVRTNGAHETLRQDGFNRRGGQEGLDPHVDQPGESARR